MANSTKQWVCEPGSCVVSRPHKQSESNNIWQLLVFLILLRVCIPRWTATYWEQIWTAVYRYLPLRFKRVQMPIAILSKAQSWELIDLLLIPYNPIICSWCLLQKHNIHEHTLRTLITKEPDGSSLTGKTSGSFYIFCLQAVAYVFKLYGIGSPLQLFSDSTYPHLILNRIRTAIAWTKQHVPIFVDPITFVGFRYVLQSNLFCVTYRYLTRPTLIQWDWGI